MKMTQIIRNEVRQIGVFGMIPHHLNREKIRRIMKATIPPQTNEDAEPAKPSPPFCEH
jgi:hypothetical protein